LYALQYTVSPRKERFEIADFSKMFLKEIFKNNESLFSDITTIKVMYVVPVLKNFTTPRLKPARKNKDLESRFTLTTGTKKKQQLIFFASKVLGPVDASHFTGFEFMTKKKT
jgi:hypothetical protein